MADSPESASSPALFRKIDCLRLPVADLEEGLRFYRDALGHELNWRTATSAGMRLPQSEAELVIHTEEDPPETDLLVDSAAAAAARIVEAGGRLVVGPFEGQVGMVAVVADPWGNTLVLLDLTRGLLVTDGQHRVTGN